MIGDSLEFDVAGGAGVGLQTAWIDSDGSDATSFQPDLVVQSVAAAAVTILDSSAMA
jgi:FMN phosphatase YigB (HAD superfamily)